MIRDALFLYCVGAGLSVFFDLSDYFNGIYCDFYLTTMSFLLTIRIAVIIIKHIIQIDFIGYGVKNMSITKIAAITGASVSTVARVLRDSEHKCHSMELKEKILQTAREIGYVPNEARALKSRRIALTAVNYLMSFGHQKIGYVGDCHNETRYIGYQEALIHHGIAPDIDNVYDIMPNEKNGYHAIAYFSKLETPPTAFYCANDILAIGMLKYLAQSKKWYYHPSIISSDNIVESQYTTPMLTTVSLPKAEMAHLAIQILTDRMNGGHKAIVKTELQSTLIIRQSVRQYISTENEPEYYI